ncbi:MAG: putative methltransferase, enzyme of biotin synthesis [Gammaproteobacteria bacterium]|nr:putative methltransferase, enzyme of biotin synthesis [Gammaproteobacteria bacterium]
MLNTKHKLIRNFNQRADTYTAAAEVQACVAERLATKMSSLQPQTILEIGCGTGLLSQWLVKFFPTASLLLTDLAPAMIAQCQKTLPFHSSITFACMDGEQITVSQPYDLIVSNMTLHWFHDLQKSYIDITHHLQRGGQFIFSLLGENSFKEWHTLCNAFKVPIATPILPADHLLQTMLPSVEIEVETYQHTYASVYAFLSSLKKIGAVTPRVGYIPLSASQLRQIFRKVHGEFKLSYEVIYGRYVRK